jgi:glycosyltransferase involved in cell wall biosynthesis
MRGGEKVLGRLCRMFPGADLFTMVRVRGACEPAIERMRIRTSVLDDLLFAGRIYRYMLPLMPLAMERMSVGVGEEYDLVVSLSHCVAKGFICRRDAAHVCYCFTPMRYAWTFGGDVASSYHRGMGLAGRALRGMSAYLRAWDRRSSAHVDLFLATSEAVAGRIASCYGRRSAVAPAPIDADYFTPADVPREDFCLLVSALTPYKRVDHAIAAFSHLGRRLVIIGSGPEYDRLRKNLPANIRMLGWQSNEVVRDHYRRCRAFIMPQEEDFGLTPLEAMACGAPVIAYGAGGALETVRTGDDSATGVLYTPQTPDALAEAVMRLEREADRFDASKLVAWARRFSNENFDRQFKEAIRPMLAMKGLPEPW